MPFWKRNKKKGTVEQVKEDSKLTDKEEKQAAIYRAAYQSLDTKEENDLKIKQNGFGRMKQHFMKLVKKDVQDDKSILSVDQTPPEPEQPVQEKEPERKVLL